MNNNTPPFFGTKIIDDISLRDIEKLIDLEALFAGRWQFRQGMDSAGWEVFKKDRAIPLFEKHISNCETNGILKPKMVYGYFRCRKSGNGIIVEGENKFFRFDFPRECEEPHRCIADFFSRGFIAIQLVTVGNEVAKAGAELFAKQAYSDTFFLKGLAAEVTEALARYGHNLIRKELGVNDDCGERFSPGFPSFPNILDQKKIAGLLKPMSIGVSLTKTCQLVPEYSTSAIISIDARAQYFRP